jgi:hypothetical protein
MTAEAGETPDPSTEDDVDPGWPWSFLLLVAAGGIYLVLRFVQMINDYILN